MHPIYKLLRTCRDDDRQIARAILLAKFKDKIKEHVFEAYEGYYILGFNKLPVILGEYIPQDPSFYFLQYDFTYEELHGNSN